ncbi:hypothetical protein FO519_009794 [Halicephalobus sp. NKZ332]|nr:hypothetical protein FO519_009794 [Halicephalobus sp. NKZ332]
MEEYSRAVKSAVSLIKPGGFLLQGGVLNSDEYYTGRCRFRCHRLTRDDVLQCLKIGLGGGSINVLFEGQFPEARLTTVEIDPTMKYIAIKWFTTKEDDKHKIIVADGVNFVKENDKKFDLILLDACYNDQTSSLSCPVAPFLDPSVIKAISDSLNPNGTLAINSYYTIIPTPKEHEELISKFKPYFRQCMVQNISKNFVLGCSKQDLPEITEEYLRIRANKIDKEITKIIGGDYKFILSR